MLNIIRSYLTLELSAKDFSEQVRKNDELVAFIQAKIPAVRNIKDPAWENCPIQARAFMYDRFDLRRTLTTGYYGLTKVGSCRKAYDMIFQLFHPELPDVEHSDYYEDISSFAIEAVPDALDGPEVGEVIFNIIAPTKGMVKTKRKKVVREALFEVFHLNENPKKPTWAQGSDWPMGSNGKPMRFIERGKKKGELVQFVFEDVDTLERRIVEQYF